ncbi:hypothetical protein MPTK1_3g20355 [Marchantia polymorpha subsp. ruderalis]
MCLPVPPESAKSPHQNRWRRKILTTFLLSKQARVDSCAVEIAESGAEVDFKSQSALAMYDKCPVCMKSDAQWYSCDRRLIINVNKRTFQFTSWYSGKSIYFTPLAPLVGPQKLLANQIETLRQKQIGEFPENILPRLVLVDFVHSSSPSTLHHSGLPVVAELGFQSLGVGHSQGFQASSNEGSTEDSSFKYRSRSARRILALWDETLAVLCSFLLL